MKRLRPAVPLLVLVLVPGLGCGRSGPLRAVGTLERDRLELVAEASEPIVERAVAEGAEVAAGDLILRLDPTRYAAMVGQARAARDQAAARVAELVRGPRAEKIREARARLAGARGTLETAASDLRRIRNLAQQGATSASNLDEAQARYDEAKAARDAASADLEAMLAGTTAEELDQVQAALAQAESALAEVELRASRLEVRAPVDGRVDALPFERGERPPVGATVAVLLASGAPYARVYVPEALRARVASGTEARVHVDGVEQAFEARVRTVESDPAFTPYYALTERDRGRLVWVAKVDLEGPEARRLPSGVPVEVSFVLD